MIANQPPETDVHGARALVEQGATYVDVREPSEWAEGHVGGAVHLPLGELDPARLPDGPLVMVCRSGNRSGRAAAALLAAGRSDVTNMAGGMLAWQAAGLPVSHDAAGEGSA